MNWVILLMIGLASLALIVGGFAYVGLKAWRLLKRGMRVSADIAPLADHLSRQAEGLAANADRLAANGDQLNANIGRLQVSIARLQVVGATLYELISPYLKLRGYLAGDHE